MAVMNSILEGELKRLESLRAHYVAEIARIPPGTISIKIKRDKKFAYRAYRDCTKVKTDYIGAAESSRAIEAIAAAKLRKKAVLELKTIDADINKLRKMLDVWRF
jgi:hypothetical protein